MNNFKILFLSLILLLGLSACQIPFTDRQVTIPFLEKKPEESIRLMQEAMLNNLKSYRQEGVSEIVLDFPSAEEIKQAAEELKYLEDEGEIDYLLVPSPIIGLGSINLLYSLLIQMTPPDIKITNEYSASLFKEEDGTENTEMRSKIAIDLGNMVYSGEISQKQIDLKHYFRLESLPSIAEMVIDQDFLNRWIVLDGYFALDNYYPASVDDNEKIKDTLKIKLEAFKKELADVNIFNFEKRLADEEVEGSKCYHYEVSLNTQVFDKLKVLAREISKDTNIYTPEKITEEIESLNKIFDNFESAIVNNSGEVWIGKKDFYLRKGVFDIKVDIIELLKNLSEEEIPDVSLSLKLNIDFRLSDFNQVGSIDIPKDAKSTQELIESSPMYVSPKVRGRNSDRVVYVKEIRASLERYYNDEGRYPDKLVFDSQTPLMSSSTTYLFSTPKNPEYLDSGVCPEDFNYEYAVSEDRMSYELKYCLSLPTGGISEGMHTATPVGIDVGGATDFNIGSVEEFGESESLDTDGDGLDDFAETIFGTDPNNPDSDGDGYPDGSEVENGYNPAGPGDLDEFYEQMMGSSEDIIAL